MPVTDFVDGRLRAIVAYLQDQTGDGFEDFIESLLRHPDVAAAGSHVVYKTPLEVALLVVGASFTHEQLDHLCKAGGFVDPRYKSSAILTLGLQEVEGKLPPIRYLKRPFPGCCFSILEYLTQQIGNDFGRLVKSMGK